MYKRKNSKVSSLSILAIAGVCSYTVKKDEKYMNIYQRNHFEKILTAWYLQIKKDVCSTLSTMQEKASNFPDPIDRAVQEEEFSLKLRNRDRERKLIKKIEITLNRLKNNKFGYCRCCTIEIGIRRLEASPIADLCIDCKTLAEMREKQLMG
ncbi:RNA polymerase-binding protein DksA [Buchnera aphidicola]|uniref:RNA polymerase-binding transcription factor DksA n=1 Tax=Buchnera aphidicola (Anoecia oenotherae) TaxID=1241833 RepID=A0A4D6XQL7_9GAMM|nr:RNA polymerase-binding protein DksA [Buchnera aphidicola]QCI19293.1 RNA polymerase-binding protein DksA [Buchnera aphidicola (Anoecia oenotherae)]